MEKISYALDPGFVAAILAVLMVVAWHVGIRLGRELRAANRAVPQFDDASMALFGLLLAFAFGTSMSKLEQRRIALIQDSNAIGDFYTCATLLKEPTRSRLQAVIRRYAELRVNVALQPINLDSALVEFQRNHEEMTNLVDQGLATGTPIAVSLTNALNAVTSNHAARLAAIRDRLPASIMALLFVSALISTILIGRAEGFSATCDPAGMLLFTVLVSFAIYVTLDLNGPERGFIRVSQEPIERLVSSMQR